MTAPKAPTGSAVQPASALGAPAIVPFHRLEGTPMKRDFKNFMWKVWMEIFGNAPTDVMYEFGDRLQHGPDKDILMGFRGLSKSYITVTKGMHELYCTPEKLVLTLSGSGEGANGNAFLAYSMLNNFDFLAHMRPRGMLRASTHAFDVVGSRMEKTESFRAISLFGQLTGLRTDYAIPDDVETPNTSETEGDRRLLRTRYAELGGSLLKDGGKIKVLGTAQTEDTLYLDLATTKGYSMWMVPVKYPETKNIKKYGPWLAGFIQEKLLENPDLAGTPVEPTRFGEANLAGRRLEYGVTEYDRQFNLYLDAGLADDKPLKIRDLIVMELPAPTALEPFKVPSEVTWGPAPGNIWQDIQVDSLTGDSAVYGPATCKMDTWQKPENIILQVDPSGEGKDETAWQVLAQHLGNVFLAHQDARLEGFSEPTMKAIARDAKRWQVNKIRIEKNYGGGMFGSLLLQQLQLIGYACTIEEENAGGMAKELRILDTLEGIITGHNLVVAAEVLRQDFKVDYSKIEAGKRRDYRLTYQLTRICRRKGCIPHDDRLDTLASGCTPFLMSLRRVQAQAIRENQEAGILAAGEKMIEARRKQGQPLFGRETPETHLGGLLKAGGMNASPLFPGRRLN